MDTPMTWQQHTLATTFGLLANFISFGVFLAPIPTFVEIRRRRSTQNFQSLPYLVALFSCMLWLYYGLLLADGVLVITINAAGCIIETVYITLYIIYAPRDVRRLTLKLLLAINVGLLLSIFLAIQFAIAKKNRVLVLGWICTSVSIAVFAAPLGVMVQVIRTKSVRSMPLALTVCLIVSASVWFFYGVFAGDMNIYLPNVIGLTLGAIQLLLYGYYSRTGRETDIERAVVQKDLRGGGENLVGGPSVIDLVEVGGRLVEVAEGGGREVAEGGADGDRGPVAVGGEEGERGEVSEGTEVEEAEGGADRDRGPVAVGGEEGERGEVAEGGEVEEAEGGAEGDGGEVAGGGEEGNGGDVAEGEEVEEAEGGEGEDGGKVAEGVVEGDRGKEAEGEEVEVAEGGEEGGEVAEGGGGEVSEDKEECGVEDRVVGRIL